MTTQNRLKEEIANIREQVNKVIEETFSTSSNVLPIDIYETETDIVIVTGALLGLQVNSVDISITDGNQLTISGQTQAPVDIANEAYHRRERKFGAFSRTMTIPVGVVAEEAKANYKDAVLKITLPKVAESKPSVVKISPVE